MASSTAVVMEDEASAPLLPYLSVFKDGQLLESLCLDGLDTVVLGRHTNCDFIVAHPSVSRHHLQMQVLRDSRQLLLTDLDSVHGTWINGTKAIPLKAFSVKEGDSIKLGASSRTYTLQWMPDIPEQSSSSDDRSGACESPLFSSNSSTSAFSFAPGSKKPDELETSISCDISGIPMQNTASNAPVQSILPEGNPSRSLHEKDLLKPIPDDHVNIDKEKDISSIRAELNQSSTSNIELLGEDPNQDSFCEDFIDTEECSKTEDLSLFETNIDKAIPTLTVPSISNAETIISSKLWLRRSKLNPPPCLSKPLSTNTPLVENCCPQQNDENVFPSAPPLPFCYLIHSVTPSAPPMPVQDDISNCLSPGKSENDEDDKENSHPCVFKPTEINSLHISDLNECSEDKEHIPDLNECCEDKENSQQQLMNQIVSRPPFYSVADDVENGSHESDVNLWSNTSFHGNENIQLSLYNFHEAKVIMDESNSASGCSEGPLNEDWQSDKENNSPAFSKTSKMSKPKPLCNMNVDEQISSLLPAAVVERLPFQPLQLTSNGTFKLTNSSVSKFPMDNVSKTRSLPPNLDLMARRLHPTPRSEQRRVWHIVVDITCFLDSISFKSLRMLEGIREVRLIIPKIVISELDCRRGIGRTRNKALKWIESCMVKLPSWIHVQSSSENMPLAATPPVSPRLPVDVFSASSTCGGNVTDLMSPLNGDHVLNCALLFDTTTSTGRVALLTSDTALRIKAMAEGLVCEPPSVFCESLLSPYSDRFLWAGSLARGHNWAERGRNVKSISALAPCSTTNKDLSTRDVVLGTVRAMTTKKNHALEGLKKQCLKQSQGLKLVLG